MHVRSCARALPGHVCARARAFLERVQDLIVFHAIPHLSEADSAPLDRSADQSVTE